jgi:hypothetical protein
MKMSFHSDYDLGSPTVGQVVVLVVVMVVAAVIFLR